MRYTYKGKYTFDLINESMGEVNKQGLAGAAAGFVANLNAQRDADETSRRGPHCTEEGSCAYAKRVKEVQPREGVGGQSRGLWRPN